ncbi:hypothetical protein [Nakamurella sp.]|uniref:hypothetical protein n=1 Tax=Nakamurella sp. TaxID=1869182 RepID=UPI003B3B1DBB
MTTDHPSVRRASSRRRKLVLGALAFCAVVAITAVFFPADAARLVGRTEPVTATVIDSSGSSQPSRSSGSSTSRSWFQHYTVTWVDDEGVEHTGESTLVFRGGSATPSPAPGDTVPAAWVPGTDRVTVATVGQSITTVFGPATTGLIVLAVAGLATRMRRWTTIAVQRGRDRS